MTNEDRQFSLTPYGSADDSSPAHIYSRYAMGDMLEQICSDYRIEPVDIEAIIREQPKAYAKTKKSRQAFHDLRVQRQLSLADALNLCLLEMASREPTLMLGKDFASDITKLTKVLAHRHALNEGKVTEIIGIDEMLTDKEMRRRIQAQDEAGDGLAMDDIGETNHET